MHIEEKRNMVSVIVPLYNQEQYIIECIASIQQQTYKNIEIVIIDDGSEDMGYSMCEEAQKEDPRIRLFHQENQGSVSSRKFGVKKALGEWVMFVDGDDYIDKWLVETLVNSADSDTDMVASGMRCIGAKTNRVMGNIWEAGEYNREKLEENFDKLIFCNEYSKAGIFQSACAKLYRREQLWKCIKDEDEKITLGEDAAIVFSYVLQAKKVILRDDSMYYYRLNNESMTQNLSCDVFETIQIFLKYMNQQVQNYPSKWKLETQLKQYSIHFLQMAIKSVYDIDFSSHYYIRLQIANKERIVLYGAGKVGKSLYNNFVEQGVEVVAWVDQSQSGTTYGGRLIQPVQQIKEMAYERIVVAVLGEDIAEEIREQLVAMGIEAEKIYWEKPKISNGIFIVDV